MVRVKVVLEWNRNKVLLEGVIVTNADAFNSRSLP